MADDEILTTQQAAALLGVHVETIRRLSRKGAIPAFRVGKDWRFHKQALMSWSTINPDIRQTAGILVVDDDQRVCRLIRRYLEPLDYRVVTAPSGADGLDRVRSDSIHLVLLDLEMPVMNGPAFLKRLKQIRPDMPVVIVTGFPDSSLMMDAYRYGPVMLIPKPVEKQLLVSAVHITLKGSLADQA